MKLRRIKSDSEVKLKKQKKNKKARKRTFRVVKRIILLALVVVALVLLARSPLFNIRKIEVYGNSKVDTESIISSTKILAGKNGFEEVGNSPVNFFLFRYGNEEKRIEKSFSYVKRAKVTFYLPDTVKINIEERKPMCYTEHSGNYILIDEDGFVLEESSKPYNKVLFVKGLTFKNYSIGQALKTEDTECIQYVKKLLSEIPKNDESNKTKLFPILTGIDVGDPLKIKIVLDSRITADMGDLNDVDYRLDFVRNIYFNKLKKADKGYLEYNDDGKYNFKVK